MQVVRGLVLLKIVAQEDDGGRMVHTWGGLEEGSKVLVTGDNYLDTHWYKVCKPVEVLQ